MINQLMTLTYHDPTAVVWSFACSKSRATARHCVNLGHSQGLAISTETARKTIAQAGNGFFSVTFTKRSNGELRTITARTGVRKGVTGKGMSYDPSSKGLIVLWSVSHGHHIAVPLDGIHRINLGGGASVTNTVAGHPLAKD